MRIHEGLDVNNPIQTINTEGLVQTTPGDNKVTSYTINSPRLFKIYLVGDTTHLSTYQANSEVIIRFHYFIRPVVVRVYSTHDYIYNGWVRLDCTEVPSHYLHQTPRSRLPS